MSVESTNDLMQPKNRAVLGHISDTDLRLLRVFQTVADCGGMSAAELELNISTSTISRHVKDLETRLGLVLCRRGRSGFALTPEGERILLETRQLLAATQQFVADYPLLPKVAAREALRGIERAELRSLHGKM